MSKVKEFYTKQLNSDYKKIQTNPRYLSELYLIGILEMSEQESSERLSEVIEILEKYQINDETNMITLRSFYHPLRRVFMHDSNKEIQYAPELALEMKLFRSELEEACKTSEKFEEFSGVLLDISKEYLNECMKHDIPAHYMHQLPL